MSKKIDRLACQGLSKRSPDERSDRLDLFGPTHCAAMRATFSANIITSIRHV